MQELFLNLYLAKRETIFFSKSSIPKGIFSCSTNSPDNVFCDLENLVITINGKLFSEFKLKFYDNLDLCTKDAANHEQLVIFFATKVNKECCKKIENNSFPLIVITKSSISQNILSGDFVEQLNIPFNVLNLEKKNYFCFSKI